MGTRLTPQEEIQFQAWKARYAPHDSGLDYDLRGAFKAGITPDPQRGHFPDTFKLPNHPTFSDESKYNGQNGVTGGHWANEKGQDVFYASPANLIGRTPQDLIEYFQKYEPGARLILPPQGNQRMHVTFENPRYRPGLR